MSSQESCFAFPVFHWCSGHISPGQAFILLLVPLILDSVFEFVCWISTPLCMIFIMWLRCLPHSCFRMTPCVSVVPVYSSSLKTFQFLAPGLNLHYEVQVDICNYPFARKPVGISNATVRFCFNPFSFLSCISKNGVEADVMVHQVNPVLVTLVFSIEVQVYSISVLAPCCCSWVF